MLTQEDIDILLRDVEVFVKRGSDQDDMLTRLHLIYHLMNRLEDKKISQKGEKKS